MVSGTLHYVGGSEKSKERLLRMFIVSCTGNCGVGFTFLAEQREDITLPDQLLKHVKNLDKLLTDVVAPKEAAVDSEGFRLISAIGREQVEATHGSLVQFDTTTYAEKLVTYMGGRRGTGDDTRSLNWTRLGSRVAKTFRRPPATNFM